MIEHTSANTVLHADEFCEAVQDMVSRVYCCM